MKLLGIDYGERKIGLAKSEGILAEPLELVSPEQLIKHLDDLCKIHGIEKIIVGISEGLTAIKTKKFIERLKKTTSVPIESWDETNTSNTAIQKLIENKRSRFKRHEKEDAVAAALILQSYIDR